MWIMLISGGKMKYNKKIVEAIFLNRPNRFNAKVLLDGEEITVHVPNTGRCRELLYEGAKVYLREELGETRKTKYDLVAVDKSDRIVSIDSQIPNKVVLEALQNFKIERLKHFTDILKEKTYKNSRFDFKLSNGSDTYYLEVKGVTLEEEGEVRFPDAPTDRGRKHLLELIDVKKEGMGAGALFLIQMEGVKHFKPNDKMDPKFGEALREAAKAGVDILAYSCKVTRDGIEIYKEVPIML